MNGALDSVSGFASITFVMAFAGPVLTLILIAFLVVRSATDPRARGLAPGIPLALTSIAPQVFIGGIGILKAFQEIALQRRAGVRNVAGSMAEVTVSFATAISLSIGCIVALIIFQVICDRRDEDGREDESEHPDPGNKLAPRIVFFLTALSAVATMALLWFFERTLDLIMVICDTTRMAEARERLGNIPIGDVAGVISRRLLLGELFSFVLLALLFTAPFWLLAGEAPEWVREKSLVLAVVTALWLIPFAVAYHQEILYMISLTHQK